MGNMGKPGLPSSSTAMVFGKGKRVLVVGGGLTAAALSSLLRSAGVNVVAWDKARRPGGRLTTHRRPGDGAAVQKVDLGGQYISVSGDYRDLHAGHYEALVKDGLLKSLNGKAPPAQDREEIGDRVVAAQAGFAEKASRPVALDHLYIKQPEEEGDPISLVMTDNYVAPLGTEEIVQDYWNHSGVELEVLRPLEKLNLVTSNCPFTSGKWMATGAGKEEEFEAVVTTMPVPQLLATPPRPEGYIEGNFLEVVPQDLLVKLKAVRYNSVFCLGVFFDVDVAEGLGIKWKSKYFPEDPAIRYVSFDNSRRGDSSAPTSICVQSHVSFAEKNLHKTKQEMAEPLMDALYHLLPELPPPSSLVSHKWRYSQTSVPFEGTPGAVLLHRSPTLIAAGDSFSHSNFDGCIASAHAANKLLKKILASWTISGFLAQDNLACQLD